MNNDKDNPLDGYLSDHGKLAGEVDAARPSIQEKLFNAVNIPALDALEQPSNMLAKFDTLLKGSASSAAWEQIKRQTNMFSGHSQLINDTQLASVSALKKHSGIGEMASYLDAYQRNFAHLDRQAIAFGQLTHMLAQKTALDQYRSVSESSTVYKEIQKYYLNPFKNLVSQIALGFDSNTLVELNKYNQSFSKYFDSGINIEINSEGMLSFGGEAVSSSQVEDGIKNLAVVGSETGDHPDQLSKVWNKLGSGVQWVILYLIVPFYISMLSSVLTPLHVTWWQDYIASNPRAAQKEIIAEATTLFNRDDLTSHRFVKATTLNVRSEGSMHAEIIGSLPPGKTVKLIEKQKSWALVEYLDPDTGELQRGWVYSRYLQKFQ